MFYQSHKLYDVISRYTASQRVKVTNRVIPNLCSELHPFLVLVKQERSWNKNSDAAIVLKQIFGNVF